MNAKNVEITNYGIMRIFNEVTKTNTKLIDGTPKHTCVQNLKKIRHLHLCFFVLTVGRTDGRTDGQRHTIIRPV